VSLRIDADVVVKKKRFAPAQNRTPFIQPVTSQYNLTDWAAPARKVQYTMRQQTEPLYNHICEMQHRQATPLAHTVVGIDNIGYSVVTER
jgi:hypothetical protein